MKKLYFALVALLLCAITASAASIPSGTKLYLKPNANWKTDNARFAVYFFGNGEAWVSMTKVEGETDLYEVTSPNKTYLNLIFCRMNPGTTANNWNNKWNQTADLTWDGTNNLYTVKEGTWDKGGGTWSKYETEVELVGAPTFSVASKFFDEPFTVEISSPDADATIHYTLDGTAPTEASTQYTGAITISETTTVKAIAYKENCDYTVAEVKYTKTIFKEVFFKSDVEGWWENSYPAVYFWEEPSLENGWSIAEKVNAFGVTETIYKALIPDVAAGFILTRQKPENAEPQWNVEAQTIDIKDFENNLFTVTNSKSGSNYMVEAGVFEYPQINYIYVNDLTEKGTLTLSADGLVFGEEETGEFVITRSTTTYNKRFQYTITGEKQSSYTITYTWADETTKTSTLIVNDEQADDYITFTNDGSITGIDGIEAENAPIEYFNLQGVRVANPENGLFIRRQGNKVEKIILK